VTSANDAPLNGAGAEHVDPDWRPRPFRVFVCDRWDPDHRFYVNVAAAIGPNDAFNQVRESHLHVSVLRADEVLPVDVVPDSATLPEWMAWTGIPMPDEPQP